MRREAVCAIVGAVALAAVGVGLSAGPPRDPVTLKEAIAASRQLGPVAPGREIHLTLALRSRRQRQLEELLRSGGSGSGGFAARYAPQPRLVRSALAAARRAGFRVGWRAGETIAALDAPARVVERFFRVRLLAYVAPSGRSFYASDRRATLPRRLRAVVAGLGGLDDFGRAGVAAIPPGGVSPDDVLSFYDVRSLRSSGLDGSGETVVFPELSSPDDEGRLRDDLAAFASKNRLPAFDVSFRHDSSWHPLSSSDSFASGALAEAALDLEIVHSLAPKAKLVVYEFSRDLAVGARAELAMVSEHPTAIVSDSTGFCEAVISDSQLLRVLEAPWEKQAVQNMAHFVASGDSGAYDCGEDQQATVDFGAALPVNTGVGGTSVFLARGGGYFRELAWGNPLSRTGGGGGFSRIYRRPAWQTGVRSAGQPGRAVPDVSGLADMNTGWAILVGGQSHQIGGTSAAAPLWAGIAALIDQHLRRDGLRRMGAASPALYWIGARQSRFHAFHDVTAGDNLLYAAAPGWDAATGWGTPDAAKLDAAWHAYVRQGGK